MSYEIRRGVVKKAVRATGNYCANLKARRSKHIIDIANRLDGLGGQHNIFELDRCAQEGGQRSNGSGVDLHIEEIDRWYFAHFDIGAVVYLFEAQSWQPQKTGTHFSDAEAHRGNEGSLAAGRSNPSV